MNQIRTKSRNENEKRNEKKNEKKNNAVFGNTGNFPKCCFVGEPPKGLGPLHFLQPTVLGPTLLKGAEDGPADETLQGLAHDRVAAGLDVTESVTQSPMPLMPCLYTRLYTPPLHMPAHSCAHACAHAYTHFCAHSYTHAT